MVAIPPRTTLTIPGPLTPFGTPTPRQRALRYWGAGLFDLNDDDHRRARRLMLPAFHKRRVETYRNQMVQLSEQMIANWTPSAQRNIHADLVDLTMGIATSTLFGVNPQNTGKRVGMTIQHGLAASFNPATLLLQ